MSFYNHEQLTFYGVYRRARIVHELIILIQKDINSILILAVSLLALIIDLASFLSDFRYVVSRI